MRGYRGCKVGSIIWIDYYNFAFEIDNLVTTCNLHLKSNYSHTKAALEVTINFKLDFLDQNEHSCQWRNAGSGDVVSRV